MTQATFINLQPNKYSQGLRYYPFAVNLERCVANCNIVDDTSNRVCVSNKTEDLNLKVFIIIREINESKILTKRISWKWEYKLMVENLAQIKIISIS